MACFCTGHCRCRCHGHYCSACGAWVGNYQYHCCQPYHQPYIWPRPPYVNPRYPLPRIISSARDIAHKIR